VDEPVIVILRWEGDPDRVLPRYEKAVDIWRERFASRGPAQTFAGASERGGVVVVNVFAHDQDHLMFGRNMGDPLAAVGLPTPSIEHITT
jgi:hypothetical protein